MNRVALSPQDDAPKSTPRAANVRGVFGERLATGLRFAVVLLAVLWAVVGREAVAQTAPAVNDVTITSVPVNVDTYGVGETIRVRVTWDGFIGTQLSCVAASNPLALVVRIGSTDRNFACSDALNVTTLDFTYTVVAADSDTDGVTITGSAVTGGTLILAGNTMVAAGRTLGTHAITNSANHKVDGSQTPPTAPTVSGVAINSPIVGTTFERNEAIDVTVTFTQAVDVVGTPQLRLLIGANVRQASYTSGTGTTALVFRYTVVQADADTNGITIPSGPHLGGTIRAAGGTANAQRWLGTHAITNSANHTVNGATVTATAVSDVSIASTPASGDGYYRLGELIWVQVTFSRAVNVVSTLGTPRVALTIGTQTRQTDGFSEAPGIGLLSFSYTVAAGDFDDDGISVAAGALTLNGAQINDARSATTPATLGLGTHAIANDAAHKVAAPPVVLGTNGIAVNTPGTASTFERGERIEVTVNFNQAVDVTGTPQLALGIGTETRQADYVSGSGTASPVFRYTVVQADVDADGISIAANALALNGGTIRGSVGGRADASLGLGSNAISDLGSRLVNGALFTTAAGVSSSIVSTPAASSDTYGLGERIEVDVRFTQRVVVTGTPNIRIGIGTLSNVFRETNYISGSGTRLLRFGYAVQGAGSGGPGANGVDADTDGITVLGPIFLNGGAVRDARNGAEVTPLTFVGRGTSSAHKVDGTIESIPEVARTTVVGPPPSGAAYGTDDEILVRVSFNRAVAVTGSPTLTLTIGSSRRRAQYESGSGTLDLLFRYVVQPEDMDPDGFSVPADALSLNGGRIVLAGGTMDATLDLGSHALENAGRVAGTPRSGVPGTPSATQTPPFVLVPAGEDVEVDLLPLFVDPEGGALTYSAASNDPNVASATVEGSTLRISGGGRAGETTVSVTATDPGGLAASVVIRVEVVGTEATCSTAPAEAPEGGKATAVVELVAAAGVSTTVRWHLARDTDPETADADADDHGGVSGEVQVRAGERCADIEIDILDDDDAEPAREWFNVVLRGGQLVRERIPVAIMEGVCDRTPVVRRALLAATDAAGCEVPASADLHRVGELRLAEAGLDALAAEDFSDLTGLRTLDLAGNGLTALPALPSLVRLERLLLPGNALEAVPLAALPAPERLRELILSDNALSELPANALATAPGLRSLRLDGNRLQTLPDGVFAGSGSLRLLRLDGNPGAPFAVRVNLERVDAQPWASAPAMLRATVPLGAPFEIAFGLAAEGATFADGGTASEATVAGGQTAGHAVAVHAAGGFARVALTVPGLPDRQCLSGPCWQGFALEAGAPLTLFARRVLGDEPVPLFGEDMRVSLSSLAEAAELVGDLEWSVYSSDPSLAVATIDGDALLVEPALGAEGSLRVEATATDANGQTTTVYFDVYVEFHWPTRSWREVITDEQR